MFTEKKNVALSTDLDDDEAVPYFLWDEPMTVNDLKDRLASGLADERLRLIGKIMREARDTDVWKFTSPAEVVGNWELLSKYLGRRRAFWEFLLEGWKKERLIA